MGNILKKIDNLKECINKRPILKKTIGFILLFIFIWICYELFYNINGRGAGDENFQTIRTLMLIVPVFSFGYGCYLKGTNKLNIKNLTFLLFISGCALRIGYAFYTGANTRQHDVEMYSNGELNYSGSGHFSYIYIIYATGRLPSEIKWQFYHPPLWHTIIALWMHIMHLFHAKYDVGKLFEMGIIVSSFVACFTLYGFRELLFNIFKEKDQGKDLSFTKNNLIIALCFALLSFHSQFFVMAGWMNNEGLAFMFMVLALLYAVKFHHSCKNSDVILCALMIGLGMTTKVSVALICVPIGVIFIYDFVDEIKKGNTKKIILKGLIFIAICLPISSWFIIRNIIKFNNPSISVPGIDPYTSSLSVINYSFFQRFGIPNIFKSISESQYCILRLNSNNYMDYNIWAYIFKCSVFGEYSYWQGELFSYFLLIFNILISLFSFIVMIYVNIIDCKHKEKDSLKIDIIMDVIYGVSLLSYIAFQILYPVTCTQDFRYMTIILLPGTYFVAKFYASLNKNNISNKIFKHITFILSICFMISSILYFISVR